MTYPLGVAPSLSGGEQPKCLAGAANSWLAEASDSLIEPKRVLGFFQPFRLVALQLAGKRTRIGDEAQEQSQILSLVVRATVDTERPCLEEDRAKEGRAQKPEGWAAVDRDLNRLGAMKGLGAAGNLDGLPLAERAWRGFQAIGGEDV